VSPLRPELPQAASHFPGTNNPYFHADIVSKSLENGCAIVHIFIVPVSAHLRMAVIWVEKTENDE
jgi:hypothetical protein